jgi:hypothetical protein
MPDDVLAVESRRAARVKLVSTLQHAFAALILISAGVQHLPHAHGIGRVLAILEIVAGAFLIGSAARDKFMKREHHDRVGWVEIAGGLMTLVEALGKLQERHHLSFYVLTFVQPVILLAIGLFEVELSRYHLTFAGDSLEIKLRRLWRKRIDLAGLTSFRADGTRFTLAYADGRSRAFDLKDVKDSAAAVSWTAARLARRTSATLDKGSAPAVLPGGEGQADHAQGQP